MPYHHLTPCERSVIDSMLRMGFSQAVIADWLHRSPSTISRELRRNKDTVGNVYDPHWANIRYWDRRKQVVNAHKTGNDKLMRRVVAKLKIHWRPEQISGRWRHVQYTNAPTKWISYQTIYRYVARDKRLGGKLFHFLARGRKPFGKRGVGAHPNTLIKGRVSIDERPGIVNEQARIGDWEGDTFFGAKRQSCLTTFVERKSLYLVARKMPNATAQALNDAVLDAFSNIPKEIVHTITLDNGKEFAGFKAFEEALESSVFFAHPYSAWERGINENTNGLLRQFIPKKKDFSNMTDEELECFVQNLNNRPRKKLGYRTPNEVFREASIALAM